MLQETKHWPMVIVGGGLEIQRALNRSPYGIWLYCAPLRVVARSMALETETHSERGCARQLWPKSSWTPRRQSLLDVNGAVLDDQQLQRGYRRLSAAAFISGPEASKKEGNVSRRSS